MRIIGGDLKGSSLFFSQNKNTRPLKDMARESIFNLLIHSNKISCKLENSNILDLYSGTGSFGLECLSRKANKVFFVEKDKSIIQILKKNINKLEVKEKVEIFLNDAFQVMQDHDISKKKFNIIFCDPPFKNTNIKELIDLIHYKKLLVKNGIIILHRNKNTTEELSSNFQIIEERYYGISKIIFGQFSH
jgi:16S rRNA (guanine966-N2)-methyltransferase